MRHEVCNLRRCLRTGVCGGCVVAGLLLLTLLAGCRGSAGSQLNAHDPPTAAAKAIELYDASGDGKLDASELQQSAGLAASVARLDTDSDKLISADEIQARLEMLKGVPKFIGLEATITFRRRPLVGAELTLTPDPFMGENYPTLTGTSVENGRCPLIGDGRVLPGVPIGFYTVRVVHTDQNVDAVQGVEIAADTTGSRLEIAL